MKIKRSIREIINLIFLIALLFYAFSEESYGQAISGTPYMVFLGLGAVFFGVQAVMKKHTKLTLFYLLSWMSLVVVLFFNNQNFANQKYGYEIIFICTVLFSLALFNRDYWIEPAIKIMLIIGGFYAAITLMSFISSGFYNSIVHPIIASLNDTSHMGKSSYYSDGFTAHYSFNGIYLAMATCTSIGLIIPSVNGERVKNKWLKYPVVVLMFIALLLTNKRAHVIFTFAGALVAYYAYNSDKHLKRFVRVIGIIFGVLIVGYLLYTLMPGGIEFFNRFREFADSDDVSNGRYEMWQIALVFGKGNVLTGSGWWSFMNYYGAHVHNIYIQLFVETGIIGTVIFGLYFFTAYVKNILTLKDSRKKKIILGYSADKYLTLSLIYQTFFVLYGITGTCLYERATIVPYIVFCTITEHYWYKRKLFKKNKERVNQ